MLQQITTDGVRALIRMIRHGIRTLDTMLFTETAYLPKWSRLGVLGVLTSFYIIMSLWMVPSMLLLKRLRKAKPSSQNESDVRMFIANFGSLSRSILLNMAHQSAACPEWLRPGLFLGLVIVMQSITVCIAGFEMVRRAIGIKPRQNPVDHIKMHVEALRTEQSLEAATNHLKALVLQLRHAPHHRIYISPYGKLVTITTEIQLLPLLYQYEAERANWHGALEVIDHMMASLASHDLNPRLNSWIKPWLEAKAACLMELGRHTEAQDVLAVLNQSMD